MIPEGLQVYTHRVFEDDRGSFREVWKAGDHVQWLLTGSQPLPDFPLPKRGEIIAPGPGTRVEFLPPRPIQQFNASVSKRGVIRGLHLQYDPPMAKLMTVLAGRALLVAADVNPHSPTYRAVHTIEVGAGDGIAVYAPAWCARGFCALEDGTVVAYLCDAEYNAAGEMAVYAFAPELDVPWPSDEDYPQPFRLNLSQRDLHAPDLADVAGLLAARFSAGVGFHERVIGADTEPGGSPV